MQVQGEAKLELRHREAAAVKKAGAAPAKSCGSRCGIRVISHRIRGAC